MRIPLIEVEGLCKSFPGVKALDQVRFELFAGEVHALMGENGAGKSTLMKILSGVYQRDSGTIRLNGQPVELGSPRAAQDLGIGIIHQELMLMNHLTVAQNIFMGREPRRWGMIDEPRMNREAARLFQQLRLQIDPQQIVGDLTVARQQMVEIAKALSVQSRVLIMDEPTAALTDSEVAELFTVIAGLRAQGVGIVYISHKMDEIRRIADRITVMRDGRYVGTELAAETTIERIIALMVGRELGELSPMLAEKPAGEVILEARGLVRGRAVRDVSLVARRGEILGLAGLMGAGRTELARLIFGADPRDSGSISVHGQVANIQTPEDAVALGIGYLSEDRKRFGIITAMDIEANVGMACMTRFLRRRLWIHHSALARAAQAAVERLGIRTPSTRQRVGLLSGGNQQKVVIAKWLQRDCDILIFDEPTRGIDVGAKREIYRLLRELADQGRAIIMISSELPEILALSDRILVMCEGRVTGELPGKGATQEQIMALATKREPSSDEASLQHKDHIGVQPA